MALAFFNTLKRLKQEFVPFREGSAGMYTCGPTVYAPAQIGNLRAFVFYDTLSRLLSARGFCVTHVMNLTDVDDKTIRASKAAGVPLREFTDKVAGVFFRDLDRMNVKKPTVIPRATEHIEEMVAMILKLGEKGHTYQSGGSTYFRVGSFPGYGKLSGFEPDNLKAGARIDSDEYEKEGAADFVLWKAWKGEDGDVFWDTPLGRGRPGWHIECSAMSVKYLGETIDIHGGGGDLVFPHHENEIAQSEAASGKPFVRYWLHNGWLLSDGKKMSKSLNNYYVLSDIEAKGFSGEDLRYFYLTNHYRQQFNFTWDGLSGASTARARLVDFRNRLCEYKSQGPAGQAGEAVGSALSAADAALDDDLGTPDALAALHTLMAQANRLADKSELTAEGAAAVRSALDRADEVLGILPRSSAEAPAEIIVMAAKREAARKARDFSSADELRAAIKAAGFAVEDTPQGPRVKKI